MSSKGKQLLIKTIIYGTILVLLIALFFTTDFTEMWQHIKRIRIDVLSVLIFFQCITQVILGMQWYRITKSLTGKGYYSQVFYILSTGSVIEALTPGAKIGGEVTRLHYLKKEVGLETKEATNIIVVQKCISMSVLFSVCIASMIYLFVSISTGLTTWSQLLLIGLSLLILGGLFIILGAPKQVVTFCENHPGKLCEKIKPWIESYINSLGMLSKKEWVLQFCISIAVWILFPLKMLILSRSMGIDAHFLILLALTMTAYMIGTLPLTPGGLGAFEGTMISLLALISVDTTIAVTVTVVFRIITFWLVMAISLVYTLLYKRFRK